MSLIGGFYTLGPEIGKGSFATVYKCFDTRTHRAVAVKSVVRSKLKSKKLIENLEIEISILKSIKHPHIVGLLDYCQTPSHFHLVIDYCSMGDLSYFIRRRDQLMKTHPVILCLLERYPSPEGSHGLNNTLLIHFLKQLASALQFLRSKSLVHRDIKPQNLLLCPPMHSKSEFEDGHYVGLWELPILKIADFGFARFLPSTSMAETLCGLPLYMAPEILRYEKYNAKADLWSVGAVLYEMTVGKPPFRAANHIELLKNIEKSHDRIKFPSSAQVSEPLKALIQSLLKHNPTKRVSFADFFSNSLIVCELKSNDTPLETSAMDESLFISEYISPIKPSDRAKLLSPATPFGTPTRTASCEAQPEAVIRDQKLLDYSILGGDVGVVSRSSRDDHIKLIIDGNSPDPAMSPHFIQPKYVAESKMCSSGKKCDDIILERDYVVVEKRAVEVNAIADELARVGTEIFNKRRLSATNERDVLVLRRSSKRSNSADSTNVFAKGPERRVLVLISPSNALGKAISLASNRLFGNNAALAIPEESNAVRDADRGTRFCSSNYISPDFENNLLLNKINLPMPASISESPPVGGKDDAQSKDDEMILRELESIATKAHAVHLFADVKFSQLIPSSDEGGDDVLLQHAEQLPPKMVKSISEEGVVLCIKTLWLFVKGMELARQWCSKYYATDETSGEQNLVRSINMATSVKINELVQWIREKFNECLEKAEFIKLRLEEVTLSISKSDQYTDSNIYMGASTNAGILTTDSVVNTQDAMIVAEKLIFDRALEISRNAAVNELVKEDLKGCELAYSTAIWMLEALLDEESAEDSKLASEDKVTVEKFIVGIGNRLSVLKRKLDLM